MCVFNEFTESLMSFMVRKSFIEHEDLELILKFFLYVGCLRFRHLK